MSRRFTDRNLAPLREDVEVAWEYFEGAGIPWWYATRMPEPWEGYFWHQWSHAWAPFTLHVAQQVARNVGGRLYAWHRDTLLREDLADWLTLQAVEAGANFTPAPGHPAPEKNYAAWLYSLLKIRATQHFANVVGRIQTPSGRAAADAHNSGVRSTEHLQEMESESGGFISRRPLYTAPFETGDPASVIILLEDLGAQVEEVEREDRRQGIYTSSSTAVGDPCLTNGCQRPSIARGLCRSHYQKERRRTIRNCSQAGCQLPVQARELCSTHYQEHRNRAVAEGTWNAYDTPDACSVDGCTRPVKAGGALGLCRRHYDAHRRATAPPCSADGCGLRSTTRGMCSTHYRRWREAGGGQR